MNQSEREAFEDVYACKFGEVTEGTRNSLKYLEHLGTWDEAISYARTASGAGACCRGCTDLGCAGAPPDAAPVAQVQGREAFQLSPHAQAAQNAAMGNGITLLATEAQEIADSVLNAQAQGGGEQYAREMIEKHADRADTFRGDTQVIETRWFALSAQPAPQKEKAMSSEKELIQELADRLETYCDDCHMEDTIADREIIAKARGKSFTHPIADFFNARTPNQKAVMGETQQPKLSEDALCEKIHDFLRHYVLSFSITSRDDSGLLLVDALTPNGDKTIERGKVELEHLADELTVLLFPHLTSDDGELVKVLNEIRAQACKAFEKPYLGGSYSMIVRLCDAALSKHKHGEK